MARKVVAMEAKLLAVLSAGLSVSVTELCAELGISRQSFYKYRRRFAEEGAAGLVERAACRCGRWRAPFASSQLGGTLAVPECGFIA